MNPKLFLLSYAFFAFAFFHDALLKALPISNTGIVVSARPNEIASSYQLKVPDSIPKTEFKPGTYIAASVIRVVTRNAPMSHGFFFLSMCSENSEP